jgi:hypothetical protein
VASISPSEPGLAVQALADLLKLTHRGYFIPPRPEKSAVAPAGMSKEAVENRQVALEHYLRQLASHPVLCESEVGPPPEHLVPGSHPVRGGNHCRICPFYP